MQTYTYVCKKIGIVHHSFSFETWRILYEYNILYTYIDFLKTFGSLRFGVYNKTHLRHPSQRLRKFTYVSWNLVPSFLCHADSPRYKILHKMNYFIVFLCSGICFLKALCVYVWLGTRSHSDIHNHTHNLNIATLKEIVYTYILVGVYRSVYTKKWNSSECV